jgi:phage gp29-like protein
MPSPNRAEKVGKAKNSKPSAGKITKSSAAQIAPTAVEPSEVQLKDLVADLGGSGTILVNGFLEQDYLAKLAGVAGLDQFDRMRKSDGQVFATLCAIEYPIRGTTWYIDPAKDKHGTSDAQAEEVAEFVENALFKRMHQTWDDTLREILTMLPFGFSVHEKVYEIDGEHVWLKALESRKQRTIHKWETEDGAPGVTQILPYMKPAGENQGKNTVSIPAAKLLVFTFRREGSNYQGVSVLRSAYKHWLMKDSFYKFDAVRQERMAVGLPTIKMPKNASKKDIAKAQAIVDGIRVNERAGLVIPFEWDFLFPDYKVGSLTDLYTSVEHHNREIAKNILAQFVEIGGHSGSGGAKATSEDHSAFFYLSLQAIAQQIADTFNRYVIPELVDLNFDGVEQYPELKFKKIGSDKFALVVDALQKLVQVKVIVPDDPTEKHVRDLLDLPPKADDAPPRPSLDPPQVGPDGQPLPGKPGAKDAPEPADTPQKKPDEKVKANERYRRFSALIDNGLILRLQKAAASPEEVEKLKKKGFKFSDDEGKFWRPLTFAERKIKLGSIRDTVDEFETALDEQLTHITAMQKADLLHQVKQAVANNDIKAVGRIEAQYGGEMARALTDVRKEMFERGKKAAANELGVRVPATSAEVRGAMRVQNDAMVDKFGQDLEHAVQSSVTQLTSKSAGRISDTDVADALESAASAIDDVMADTATMRTLSVMGAFNLGRATVFERYPERVHAMQYSAILDNATCDYCLSMDGRVMEPAVALARYQPPGHWECRCLLVEILMDEEFKPEIEDVPDSIPTIGTLQEYEDIDVPEIKEGSAAARVFRRELEERRAKVEEYRAAGTHPQRIEQHLARIADLEDALDFGELKERLSASGIHFQPDA